MDRDFWSCMPVAWYRSPKDPAEKAKYDSDLWNGIHFPGSQLPEDMKQHLNIPAFTDILYGMPYMDDSMISQNPDGTWSFDPAKFLYAEPLKNKPFLIKPTRFTRPYSKDYVRYFYLEKYNHDLDKYSDWKSKYPNLCGVQSLSEWGNEANIVHRRIEGWHKAGVLTDAQVTKLNEYYPKELADRKDFVNLRLKRMFDRVAEIWYNDPGSLTALEGYWCINHLAAYWGVKQVIMETSRHNAMWQFQMMFNRGAARQFNLPWGWYVASYYTGFDSKGEHMTDSEPAAWEINSRWKPDCGLSMSLRERAFYMTYFSGANFFEREDTDCNYWNRKATGDDRWKPAPEGQTYINFYNFTRKNPDRGTSYNPVALLVAYDRGTSRDGGKAFRRYRYLKGDNMLDAFATVMFRRPPESFANRRGVEMSLFNNKYGDIFDALTPDFEKSEAFARALPAYKAAILIGGYPKHPEMTKVLTGYVKNGGTLVLNVEHLNQPFPADFAGAELTGENFNASGYKIAKLRLKTAQVLVKDEEGNPIFTVNKYGKGNVILCAPRFLVPDYDDSRDDLADAAWRLTRNGEYEFEYVEYLLDLLAKETLPAAVKGDIQYGFNKTADGWWIYLINNKGVTKFTDTLPKFDMSQRAEVTIELGKIKAASVRELVSDKSLSIADGSVKISVGPGRFAVLKITRKTE